MDQNTLEDENYGYSIGCQSIFFSGFLHGLFDFVEHQRRSGRKGYSSESVKAWTERKKKKKKKKTRIKRERQTFRNKTEEIYANIFLSKKRKKKEKKKGKGNKRDERKLVIFFFLLSFHFYFIYIFICISLFLCTFPYILFYIFFCVSLYFIFYFSFHFFRISVYFMRYLHIDICIYYFITSIRTFIYSSLHRCINGFIFEEIYHKYNIGIKSQNFVE